jgi:hypothetical protein
MKKELSAQTTDEQRTKADNGTSASVEASPMLCAVLVQLKHPVFGLVNKYYKCENPAKYKVTYIQSHNGQEKTELMCGVHFNAIKKSSERVKKITGFDSNINSELVSNGA